MYSPTRKLTNSIIAEVISGNSRVLFLHEIDGPARTQVAKRVNPVGYGRIKQPAKTTRDELWCLRVWEDNLVRQVVKAIS